MTAEITQLNSPIDVMYLIHKALRAEAARVEQAVTRLEIGGSFKPFLPVFYRWATELGYHIDVEEKYMLARFPEAPLCQDTEAEKRLMERLEDLQTYLHTEIGRTMVIARTRRNLFAKVVALRMVQDDLLEAEEESVLPVAPAAAQHSTAVGHRQTSPHRRGGTGGGRDPGVGRAGFDGDGAAPACRVHRGSPGGAAALVRPHVWEALERWGGPRAPLEHEAGDAHGHVPAPEPH